MTAKRIPKPIRIWGILHLPTFRHSASVWQRLLPWHSPDSGGDQNMASMSPELITTTQLSTDCQRAAMLIFLAPHGQRDHPAVSPSALLCVYARRAFSACVRLLANEFRREGAPLCSSQRSKSDCQTYTDTGTVWRWCRQLEICRSQKGWLLMVHFGQNATFQTARVSRSEHFSGAGRAPSQRSATKSF
jgi:hypothetical protein